MKDMVKEDRACLVMVTLQNWSFFLQTDTGLRICLPISDENWVKERIYTGAFNMEQTQVFCDVNADSETFHIRENLKEKFTTSLIRTIRGF